VIKDENALRISSHTNYRIGHDVGLCRLSQYSDADSHAYPVAHDGAYAPSDGRGYALSDLCHELDDIHAPGDHKRPGIPDGRAWHRQRVQDP
jgi:hypothetical protein